MRLYAKHLDGHKGHPWNEFADSLATYAGGNVDAGAALPPDILRTVVSAESDQWAWLFVAPSDTRAAYLSTGQEWEYSVGQTKAAVPHPVVKHSQGGGSKGHKPGRQLSVSVLTHNIETMQRAGVGKPACVRKQLEDRGIAIAGFQEGRRDSFFRVEHDWLIMSSGCNNGHLGCELCC